MSHMIEHPLLTLALMGVSVAGLGSFLVHSIERSDMLIYDTAWYVGLTELTVGYGQMSPGTDVGRLVAIVVSVLGGGTLVLLFVTAGRQVGLRYRENRMLEELYSNYYLRKTLRSLACLYIQRKWRLQRARHSNSKSRLRLLLQMQEIHSHFRKKLSKSLKPTLNLDDEMLLFDHNVFKVLTDGRKRLQILREFTRKAALFSTKEMVLTARLLSCKRGYFRLILQSNYALMSQESRAVRRNSRRRNSIMSKRETDMARKRLMERIGGRAGSVKLRIDWRERAETQAMDSGGFSRVNSS